MHVITCADCGTGFNAKTQRRKLCDDCKRSRYLAQQRARPRRTPSATCTDCGKPVYRGRGSLPNPTCRPCRSRRNGYPQDEKAAHLARLKRRQAGQKSQPSDQSCAGCSTTLTVYQVKQGQRYCSHACGNRRGNPKAQCQHCGQDFWTKRDRKSYCSDQCRLDAVTTRRHSWQGQSWQWVCYLTYSTCQGCGIVMAGRRPKSYCSNKCRERVAYALDPDRFSRRSHKRRARMKKQYVDDVQPRVVFERDKWKCHICGGKTRKRPRFKRDPEMASLDHLVPLSLGGEHSYANTACSHLVCNLRKHTKSTGEQLMIVGFA